VYHVLLLALIFAVVGFVAPARAEGSPTLNLRTVTLMPFSGNTATEGGFMLDLHFIPIPANTDKWWLFAQDILARHTSASWFQTGQNLTEIGDLSKGSPGVSVDVAAREAKVNGGVVWKRDTHTWYWHISFGF
jgi:hypothetical protein